MRRVRMRWRSARMEVKRAVRWEGVGEAEES